MTYPFLSFEILPEQMEYLTGIAQLQAKNFPLFLLYYSNMVDL